MIREGIIRIAKKNDIDINCVRVAEKVIYMEIYERSREKKDKFLREVNRTYKRKISYVDLIRLGLDRDIKGNTLEGSKPLYLVDDDYYRSIVREPTNKQLSMF